MSQKSNLKSQNRKIINFSLEEIYALYDMYERDKMDGAYHSSVCCGYISKMSALTLRLFKIVRLRSQHLSPSDIISGSNFKPLFYKKKHMKWKKKNYIFHISIYPIQTYSYVSISLITYICTTRYIYTVYIYKSITNIFACIYFFNHICTYCIQCKYIK